MMRRYFILFLGMALLGCEDVIDVNLNDADPKLVIAANVSILHAEVSISRVVSFQSDQPFDPVREAEVILMDMQGGGYVTFEETRPGYYLMSSPGFQQNLGGTIQGREFRLVVTVDGNQYSALSSLPDVVAIDSIGTSVSNLFGEERKFVSVKYQDPPDSPNYYRFLQSVNGGPFKMRYVTNDKFNDGKYVTEGLLDMDVDLVVGDSVQVRMQSIDKATYDFWNAVQSVNPGTAAPANPPSVFGDRALGYFNLYTQSQVSTVVQ